MSIYQTSERLVRYQDLAAQAHAAGFASEAKRKEALDYTNRAYEIARGVHHELLRSEFPWNEATRSYPQAYYDLSDIAPYGLHQWRPKHAAQLAAYPDFVAKVTSLAALRDGIKGQPLVAKKSKPKTAAQVAKEAAQMTCQICGRGIFAEAGVIAHHGYERPGTGWQTPSCEGARQLPFEVERDRLGEHLCAIRYRIERDVEHLASVEAEAVPVPFKWYTKEIARQERYRTVHVERTVQVTRENHAAVVANHAATKQSYWEQTPSFDELKVRHVAKLAGELKALRDYATEQQQRFDGWTQTHRAGGKGETTWVAL